MAVSLKEIKEIKARELARDYILGAATEMGVRERRGGEAEEAEDLPSRVKGA